MLIKSKVQYAIPPKSNVRCFVVEQKVANPGFYA
jgi:hypothetical protein